MGSVVVDDRTLALAFDSNRLDAAFLEDPYPSYHLLRRHDPVHRNPDGSYFLTRYDDVLGVYRDRRMSSDKQAAFRPKFGDGALYRHHTTSLTHPILITTNILTNSTPAFKH